MNDIELPSLPRPRRLAVKFESDGIRVNFPLEPNRILFWGAVLAVAFVGLFVFLYAKVPGEGLDITEKVAFAVVVWIGLFCLACVAICKFLIREQAIVRVDPNTLTIVRLGFVLQRRWTWHRSQLRGITDWHGLRVVTEEQIHVFFAHQPRNEIFWLKDAISAVMRLPKGPVPLAEEMALEILGPYPVLAGPGFLLARPGSLVLRYAWCERPNFEFFNWAAFGWKLFCRMCLWGIRPLSPGDIICRIDEADAALVQVNSTYPAILVQFRCKDKEGIHAALAQFWGPCKE